MQSTFRQNSNGLFSNAYVSFSLLLLIITPACKKPPQFDHHEDLDNFNVVNLVGNDAKFNAARIDADFINGWGIAFAPSGVAWVSSEGTARSEVWDKSGNQLIPAVSIPSHGDKTTGGHPSGQVFNNTTDFKLANGQPARFIFAGLDGIISAWNGGPSAAAMVDDSEEGAVYSGIAIAQNNGANYLFVANFSKHKIDVYDKDWNEVSKPFKDYDMPSAYGPFNIQNIGGDLYVMYAKVGAGGDEEKGAGNGYVDIFKANGLLVKRFATRGTLNAPWGIAKAPAVFWDDVDLKSRILVGNFGDGRINVFEKSGKYVGQLRKHNGIIQIGGLWGISFAPETATSVDPGWLYFAAGPDDEGDGLFGYIEK
jgi:uncharacterized protein (TIGR03118 family)